MDARKKAVKSQYFIHEDVASLLERSNSEVISLEQPLVCVME